MLGGEYIITTEGLGHVDFNRLMVLNESAAYLWQSVEGEDFDCETLTGLLVERYDIDRERAANDAHAISEGWLANGIVED